MSNEDTPEVEALSLRETLLNAALEWCGEHGGFPIAFICAFDMIDSEGDGVLVVTEMENQPTHRSMGLTTYLDAWYRDDAQITFAGLCQGDGE